MWGSIAIYKQWDIYQKFTFQNIRKSRRFKNREGKPFLLREIKVFKKYKEPLFYFRKIKNKIENNKRLVIENFLKSSCLLPWKKNTICIKIIKNCTPRKILGELYFSFSELRRKISPFLKIYAILKKPKFESSVIFLFLEK